MAKKVLFGENYTQSRFAGIMHETWVAYNNGQLTPSGNITIYGDGEIVTNSITSDIGLILDSESEYFEYLPSIHVSRLVDVVENDGWLDSD